MQQTASVTGCVISNTCTNETHLQDLMLVRIVLNTGGKAKISQSINQSRLNHADVLNVCAFSSSYMCLN